MSATIKLESAAFTNALRRYKKEVKEDTERFILEESGRFLKEVVKHSFPKKRKHGVQAVRRDLTRAVKPLRHKSVRGISATFDDIRDNRLRMQLNDLLRARNYTAIENILRNFKGRRKTEVVPFSPRLHDRARDSRGRVNSRRHIYTPDVSEWERHRRKKEQNVGLHKHGWTGSVHYLRRLGIDVKFPKWVEKPRRKSPGTAFKTGYGNRFVFEMRNPYGYVKGSKETVRFVLGLRARKMNANINRLLRENAAKTGFGVR